VADDGHVIDLGEHAEAIYHSPLIGNTS